MVDVPASIESMDPWMLMKEAIELSKENKAPVENYPVIHLPDGDIHVCKGAKCSFLELNADKCYVCSLTGICYGTLSIREDFSTGRQAGSSNPDDHAGEPVGGQWKTKKDMRAMSSAAYSTANSIQDEEATWGSPGSTKGKEIPRPTKRGARCVDEPDIEPQIKRSRMSKRCGSERDIFRALQQEAEATLCKLVTFDKRSDSITSKPNKLRDPRLQNKNVLFQAAVKKYTKECMASGTVPTLDAVHNLALAAANVAAEERRKAAQEEGRSALLLRVNMRDQVTSLAVNLWHASVCTPYMYGGRRGADSFRPFVCGMLYALKRGVSLPDGTVVVPACPQLASALPALRSTAANSVAKTLHGSSHRGLCTLHRSISSCRAEQAKELYKDAARLAQQLSLSVRTGEFDLC